MSGSHLSKDFFELVKSIGESKSKQEEDRIIVQEVAQLKRKMSELGTTGNSVPNKKKQKEFLIRLMYVEMLGHDASFGYIKAVEMTASTNLLQKRVGYLACSLTLSPTHEFRFMIINQLQRDSQSPNHLEVCAALMAVCKLVTVEMIPAVQPMIVEALRHEAEIVRKKAVMAIHRFHQLNPDSIADFDDKLRRTLCDRDPSVMGAALCILHDLALVKPTEYKDLVPSYVSILKQITEHRLPREFDYHRIPAPWIQIRLLKILALLGQADQTTSEGMYEVLHDVMRRADTGINVGYAIIYECVRTVTTIYPNSTLLDAAAASISRFISSDNHNLKYLGVTGLAAIVKDHPRYAAAHQMAVIDCLEDPDETLKRKTLDLLYRMTNPVNVEFISEKLTQFLREATDVFLRTELVSRITQCAERYAPSNAWYIQTMTNVFELGGDLVRPEVAHNLLRLIAEGSGEDEEQDMELRRDAVDTYLDLLDRPILPDILVCTMAWVLGEYGYLSEVMHPEEISERLCELVDRPFNNEEVTRGYILTAVTKLTAQIGHSLPIANDLMKKYKTSRSVDLQQRCLEYLSIVNTPELMTEVFPMDASCEDIEVDPNMGFVSSFVEQAIAKGAPRYEPPEDSDEEGDYSRRSEASNRLNFEAYKKPEIPYPGVKLPSNDLNAGNRWGAPATPETNVPPPASQWGTQQDPSGYPQNAMAGMSNFKKPSVKNVWGPNGLNNTVEPPFAGQAPPDQNYSVQGNSNYGVESQHTAEYPAGPAYGNEPHYEHDEEPVVDQRQMMASALFGGIPGAPPAPTGGAASRRTSANPRASGTNGTTFGTSRRNLNSLSKANTLKPRRSIKPDSVGEAGQQSMPQPAQPKMEVDLLDISFDAPPSNYPSNSAAPATSAPSLDPFGMNNLVSALAPAAPVANTNSVFQYNGRPLEVWSITTPEFGANWGACPCEIKSKINVSSIRTLDDFTNRVIAYNIKTVEAIAQSIVPISYTYLQFNPKL